MTKPADAPSGEPLALRCNDVLAAVEEAKKACTRCGEVKRLSDYAVDKRAKSGTQSACKHCQAEIRKARRDKDRAAAAAWKERNAEHARAKNKEYRSATKDRRLELERKRYWKDLDKQRSKAAKYRAKNHEAMTLRNRERLRKDRESLGPVYVAKVLGMRPKEVPPPLLAMKQEQLALRRLARQLRKATDESSKDPR